MPYLRETHRHLRRPPIVVIDSVTVHRSVVRQLRQSGAAWFHVEWLPPYALNLNPVEAI